MNLHTLQSDDQHQQILLLLPWYVNQSLEPTERRQVEDHIRSCLLCRRELVHLDKLAVAVKQASDLDVAAEESFNGLRAKLQITRQQAASFDGSQSPCIHEKAAVLNLGLSAKLAKRIVPLRSFLNTHGPRLALAASLLLAIVPLAIQYSRPPTTVDYHTLSDVKPEPSGGPQLRVVFAKSLSDTDINALLAEIRGERIEGPNSVGAYTVRLAVDKDALDLSSAIAFLRKQRDVMLAEPVSMQP